MTHLPDTAPAGPPSGDRKGGLRVAGFVIRLQPGAYLLAVFAAAVSALGLPVVAPGWPVTGYLAAAAGVVGLLLVSMIVHELAHALVARRHGVTVVDIPVGFFGGFAHASFDLPTPRAQWQVAAAGPAASLLLGGLSAAAAGGLSALGASPLPVAVFVAGAWINGVLTIFNVLPGAGLDGGRVVRALSWARSGDPAHASLVAARVGQITGAVLAAAGLAALVLGHADGVWLGLIGLLMVASSRAEARQAVATAVLSGLRVRDLVPGAHSPAPVIAAWQTVEAFLHGPDGPEADPGRAATAFPLRDFDGRPAGLLTLGQLAAVPPGRRDSTRLSEVATPASCVATTTPDEALTDLLARLSRRPAVPAALYTTGHAVVLDENGTPAGVLTPADFARAGQLGALRRGQPPG